MERNLAAAGVFPWEGAISKGGSWSLRRAASYGRGTQGRAGAGALERSSVLFPDAFARPGDADEHAASRAVSVCDVFADRVPADVVTQC